MQTTLQRTRSILLLRTNRRGESLAIGPLSDYNDDAHAFELRNIPVGTYELYAVFRRTRSTDTSGSRMPATAFSRLRNRMSQGSRLRSSPMPTLPGRSCWIDRSPAAPWTSGMFTLNRQARILHPKCSTSLLGFRDRLRGNDGTFRIPGGVTPGRYWLSFEEWRLPSGVYLDSATMEGESISGASVTLVGASTNRVVMTLKGDGGSIQEQFRIEIGEGVPEARVVLLSLDDRRDDRASYRFTAANEGGEFDIDGVRPDSYLLFAFNPPVDESSLRNRAFVMPYLTRGLKLDVKKGEKIRVDLDAIVRP